MTDWRQQNVDTYNKSAAALAEYFRGIGPRTADIEKALELAGKPRKPKIVEIGCGDGRDASEIISRADWYLGFDTSKELIKLAKSHVTTAHFEVADAVNFNFPDDIDIVFAFASLLHSNKSEARCILESAAKAIKPGGIFFMSLKYAQVYEKRIKTDRFGKRLFYFYNPKLIEALAGNAYRVVLEDQQRIGDTDWFTLALQRR